MKLAVIGGGSTYTPELIDGIARLTGDIKITELVLVPIRTSSELSVVGPQFSARKVMAASTAHSGSSALPIRRASMRPLSRALGREC